MVDQLDSCAADRAWPATDTHGRILARVLHPEAAGIARCPLTNQKREKTKTTRQIIECERCTCDSRHSMKGQCARGARAAARVQRAGNANCNLDKAIAIWKRKLAKSLSRAIHPMSKKGQTINSILAFLTFACLTSYATADESITQEKINQIRPGQTTEKDLVRTFGSPATETLCPVGERSLDWFTRLRSALKTTFQSSARFGWYSD